MPTRGKSITPEALVSLGPEVLAGMLIEHASADPSLRKKLNIQLAGAKGSGKLADEIDKRLKTIARSRSYVDWDKRKTLTRELDHLRTTIADQLARSDHVRAVDLLWDFIAMENTILQRMGDGAGGVDDIFGAAMADLGRLSAMRPSSDRPALARRILAHADKGEFGGSDALIHHMSEALGPEGRAQIRHTTEAALQAVPRPAGAQDWRDLARRRRLAWRLALLADLEADPDAFIAAIRAGGMETAHTTGVAERLLAANRPAEALQWLDNPQRPVDDELIGDPQTDLRIAALDALERKDEAQAVRWDAFERFLSAETLRAYLKRLPDFEDFDAEQKALAVAASHRQAERALAFFIEWRALDRADRLVRDRLSALDGRLYEVLRAAAEALEEKYPEAATLLYRHMIESVLDRASSKQYIYASRDLVACTRLLPHLPQPSSIESHNEFIVQLRKAHGRKHGFWSLVEPAGH